MCPELIRVHILVAGHPSGAAPRSDIGLATASATFRFSWFIAGLVLFRSIVNALKLAALPPLQSKPGFNSIIIISEVLLEIVGREFDITPVNPYGGTDAINSIDG